MSLLLSLSTFCCIFANYSSLQQIRNKQFTHTTMKKNLMILALLLFTMLTGVQAQKKFSLYAVGFYNQENLFDTCHDEGKRDYDFLPNGSYKWNGLKYKNKLHNMAQALADLGTDKLPGVGCAAIGLSEVENSRVLDALIEQPALKQRGYKYVHVEGPDRRGIDCALLYNPRFFTVRDVKLVPYVPEEKKDSGFVTRGYLTVSGTMAGENVAIIVCHWPSRFSTSYYREVAARQVRVVKDSLMRADKNCKVMVMGDMNDDPTNKSMTEGLSCKSNISEVGKNDMYNPWYNILVKEGRGTLFYNGSWNLFDQIVMSPNMINPKGSKDYSTLKLFQNQIHIRPYLLQSEGKYKGAPKRTTAGGVWLNGYSDHLPVVVYLVKEQK